jgi:DNA-binding NarL/FixJ family response regulator
MPADLCSGCVLVGQGHQRLSEGLRGLLQASFENVFIVADQPSLIEGAHKLQPALVLIDLALAGGALPTLLAELQRGAPRCRTLVLSDHEDACVDASILSSGADGVVHKAALATELLPAVDAVLEGRRHAPPTGAH